MIVEDNIRWGISFFLTFILFFSLFYFSTSNDDFEAKLQSDNAIKLKLSLKVLEKKLAPSKEDLQKDSLFKEEVVSVKEENIEEKEIEDIEQTKLNAEASAIYNPVPKYPFLARLNKYEGKVLIEIKIDEKGVVRDASILKSSDYDVLDREALRTAKKWKFQPAVNHNGSAMESTTQLPFLFKLEE